MTSSADRMVGMDHAEVRYFTRYVERDYVRKECFLLTRSIATIIMVITAAMAANLYGSDEPANSESPSGIHEEMLVSSSTICFYWFYTLLIRV